MASTYLITGGAGFIGSHLTLHLIEGGERVKVLDNFSSRPRSEFEDLLGPLASGVEIIEADLRDRSACKIAAANADYVLHHAAMASVPASIERPEDCVAINVLGTTNLLNEVAVLGRCKRFVFASSSALYGNLLPVTKTESSALDPLSPYATSKLAGELLCRNFTSIYGLPTVCLRYFNVYGARQDPNGPYAAVIPKFIEAVLAGNRPVIFGDGGQSRDFVSVSDVVQVNVRSCIANATIVSGKAFNIGSGRQTTLNDLVKVVSSIIGRPVEAQYLPARIGDIRHSLADIGLALDLLNFRPAVSFEDGIRRLLL